MNILGGGELIFSPSPEDGLLDSLLLGAMAFNARMATIDITGAEVNPANSPTVDAINDDYHWLREAARLNRDLLPTGLPAGYLALRDQVEVSSGAYLEIRGIEEPQKDWTASLTALQHGGAPIVLPPEYAGLLMYTFKDLSAKLGEDQTMMREIEAEIAINAPDSIPDDIETLEELEAYERAGKIPEEDRLFDEYEEDEVFDGMILADGMEQDIRLFQYTTDALVKVLRFYGVAPPGNIPQGFETEMRQ